MKINESYKPLLKDWLYGIAFYLIPFIIGYFAFSFILSDSVLHTDVDSARYMLSALVQGEAAIVALVVTLSLVAVQLAAQSYSARVIEVFRRTPDLWILMGIYGGAIFYGLGVLKMIERANPQLCAKEYICLSNLEGYVSGAYYLGVFAFVALVPYMWNTLEMLKPSTVIKMLAERITKESILSAFDDEIYSNRANPEKDPILPIIDIVRGALMKYDYETVREGLKAIDNHTNLQFEKETFENEDKEKVLSHILTHFTGIGKLAASKKDENSIFEAITHCKEIGIRTAKFKLVNPTSHAIDAIEILGIEAANYTLKFAAIYAINSLEIFSIEVKKHGLIAPPIRDYIENINKALNKS